MVDFSIVMRLSLLKNIKRIYFHPKYVQWMIGILLSLTALALAYYIIESVYLPVVILLLPVAKPVGHFLMVPLLRLLGLLKYYSPMLIGINTNEKTLEIHNGSSFDYLINMRWRQRGLKARKRMMIYYLKGFLKIIDDLEKKRLPEDVTLTGISYFFSNKSARKIGFTEKSVGFFRKILFFVDYVNLFLMYSYSNGRLSFPDVSKLRKVEISGKKLLQSKKNIIRLLTLIKKRNEYKTIPAV